ncbi:MAG: hypothetical protein S4CHLAM102_11770 [Chlamydiia bacterium]|nr:hypothetical protein [Chlamydiia bacterium]
MLLAGEVEEESSGIELFGGIVGDRFAFLEKGMDGFEVKTDRVVDGAASIGNREEFCGVGVELVEVGHLVSGYISIGTSGYFDGEGVGFGIDAEVAEHFFHVDIDAKRGDAKLLVVDADSGLTADKGGTWFIAHFFAEAGNPIEHRVVHIFIGAEVDIFGKCVVVDDFFCLERSVWVAVDKGEECVDAGALGLVELVIFLAGGVIFKSALDGLLVKTC